MRFSEFKEHFKDFLVFSPRDIRKIDPGFHLQQLNWWQKKGLLKKVINGYYILPDMPMDEHALFLIANTLYAVSYTHLDVYKRQS